VPVNRALRLHFAFAASCIPAEIPAER